VAALNAAPAPHGVLRLLDRTTFDVGGVRVIGATLWFHVPLPEPRTASDAAFLSALNHGCADFSKVKISRERLSIEAVREMHRSDVEFIAAALAAARAEGLPALVLTHHAPVLDALHRGCGHSALEELREGGCGRVRLERSRGTGGEEKERENGE
jgi:hypothetical protein